jgi:excisionase family DNA binding protein
LAVRAWLRGTAPAVKTPDAPATKADAPTPERDAADADEAVLIDVVQAAKMLSVNRSTVFKLTSVGKFPRPVKLGRATRWPKEELLAWIKAGCPSREKWDAMRDSPATKFRKKS